MKEIAKFEEIIRKTRAGEELSASEENVNTTLYWAYRSSKDRNLETLDFSDVIWDRDIPQILETLKAEGLEEFTISSTFSGLLETIWGFEQLGCRMEGLVQVRQPYDNFNEDTMEMEPAYKPAACIKL